MNDQIRPSLKDLEDTIVKKKKTLSFLRDSSIAINASAVCGPALALMQKFSATAVSPDHLMVLLGLSVAAQFGSSIFNNFHQRKFQKLSNEILMAEMDIAERNAEKHAEKLSTQIADGVDIDESDLGHLVHLRDEKVETFPFALQREIYRAQTLLCLDAQVQAYPKVENLIKEIIQNNLPDMQAEQVTPKHIEEMKEMRNQQAGVPGSFRFSSTHPDLNAIYLKGEDAKSKQAEATWKRHGALGLGIKSSFVSLFTFGACYFAPTVQGLYVASGLMLANGALNVRDDKKEIWSHMHKKTDAKQCWTMKLKRIKGLTQ